MSCKIHLMLAPYASTTVSSNSLSSSEYLYSRSVQHNRSFRWHVRRCHTQSRQKIIVAPKINDNVHLVYNTPNATVYYIYRTHVVLDILCFLVFLVNLSIYRQLFSLSIIGQSFQCIFHTTYAWFLAPYFAGFWIGSKVFVLTVLKCDFWTPPPWRALRAVLQTPEMRMALDETVRKVLLGDEVLEMMA